MGQFLIGCSGWNYSDAPDKGGWTGVFYPDKDTKRLRYYSQFFNTVEMDSSFYEKFYSQMTKGTFIGMVRATPEKFQFSVKVPETITHVKRMNVEKGAIGHFEEFLDKIFEMFYRVSHNSIGTGLGLYLVKESVKKLNGKIKVESQKEKGSKFSICIPNN